MMWIPPTDSLIWSNFPGVEDEAAMRSVRLLTGAVMQRFHGKVEVRVVE